MRPRRVAREPEVDPFYDMLFNMLIAFVFCFIVALLAMNPTKSKAGDIPAKAEYIITLSGPTSTRTTSTPGCATPPARWCGSETAKPG